MAKFIGTAGDFMKEKALNRRLNVILAFFMVFAAGVFILGWISGYMWGSRTLLSGVLVIVAFVFAMPAFKVFGRQFDKQLRLSRAEENGADGERDFVKYLKNLPDTYTVVSDLDFADSYGNIDHLIIGPTGVFSIDVKNWKGTVTPDGKGELLLNGKPTDKPQCRYFTRRTMDFKERLKALTKLEPYVQCVFAFLHTHVEAKWGTTGAVHCIRADQISDYVTKFRANNLLTPTDIPRLVSAAKSLKENAVTSGKGSVSAPAASRGKPNPTTPSNRTNSRACNPNRVEPSTCQQK